LSGQGANFAICELSRWRAVWWRVGVIVEEIATRPIGVFAGAFFQLIRIGTSAGRRRVVDACQLLSHEAGRHIPVRVHDVDTVLVDRGTTIYSSPIGANLPPVALGLGQISASLVGRYAVTATTRQNRGGKQGQQRSH
jgi:hypothetical protein